LLFERFKKKKTNEEKRLILHSSALKCKCVTAWGNKSHYPTLPNKPFVFLGSLIYTNTWDNF